MATAAPPPGYVAPGHPHYQHRQMPRLGPFNPNKTHDDPERWICIYPAYLNSKKSIQEGRRIPKDKAVDTPTFEEMKMVLDDAKVDYILERKFYSRERSKELPYIGRFRIHLKDKEGEFIRPEFDTRESVMLYLAEKIPMLKCRTNPKAGGSDHHGGGQGGQQAAGGQGGGQQGQGKKKKGKK
eukprot:TRINITY_DN3186_c0_g1_i6.p1 TRINITY_DN3186_c0_g1~~TRINITY_DN3186_c0_g1_i6.p1  ORF type:complete len:183 (+),score=54.68 TRINITY_DN3186_c0_g1_i6:56-604(+)